MKSPLNLRGLTRADLPFADALRALAGWNQTIADWERLMALAPEGCFLAEWNGTQAGTATTLMFGEAIAWIGMVLVLPEYRHRGVGRALLLRCIEHLQSRQVRCIKLDATPEGQPLYQSLGFNVEWTLTRWGRNAGAHGPSSPAEQMDFLAERDRDAVERLDAEAFGANRCALLRQLIAGACCARVAGGGTTPVEGFGLLRPGARAMHIGPVVSNGPHTARFLIDSLVHAAGDAAILWDVPDPNLAAADQARRHGFTPERSLTRMVLGNAAPMGNAQMLFAIAGPEIG